MRNAHGEQYAQVDNADPFASPVWRSPVHRTPEWIIWLVQLIRLLIRVAWFLIRHPLLDVAAGILVLAWVQARWPGVIAAVATAAGVLVVVRITCPDWFARLVTVPARCRWRWWWCYRRRWRAVMTIAGLAPTYRGQVTAPVLGKVCAGACADLVTVRLVSGQSPKAFADRAEELAHGFAAHSCRVRTARPGMVVLEFVRRDALAAVIPPCPSRPYRTCGRCPWAGVRTGRCSRSGCTAHTCWSPGPPAPGKAPTCGAWSAPCCPRWRPDWCGCTPVTRS